MSIKISSKNFFGFRSVILCLCVFLTACSGTDEQLEQMKVRSHQMPEWFDKSKFGIFIHWGLPSVPAYAAGKAYEDGELGENATAGDLPEDGPYSEWYQFSMVSPKSKTHQWHKKSFGKDAPYDIFKPVFEKRIADWDPTVWAELFSAIGAEYVVLVTKHHDGYTLWPSEVSNPHKSNWNSERDLVGELAEAVRAKGIRFGTYYSTGLDWTFKLPAEGDVFGRYIRSAPTGQDYADYAHAQVRELIDRYKPDVVWADIGYPSQGDLKGLLEYYFDLVPEGVVNDRWHENDIISSIAEYPGGEWLAKKVAASSQAKNSLLDESGNLRAHAGFGYKTKEYTNVPGIFPSRWESTRGIGGSFAYNEQETEKDMLTGIELITFLVDTASKNGSILINVGPDSYGQIPAMQQKPLLEMGDWLKVNGKAILGARPWSNYGGQITSDVSVRYMQDGDNVYAIVLGEHSGEVVLDNLGLEVTSATLLGGGDVSFNKQGEQWAFTLEPVEKGATPAQVIQIPKS